MYTEYFRHLLINEVHEHFPNFDKTTRTTIEDESTFVSIIREYHPSIRIDRKLIMKMKSSFLAYLARRSGSLKLKITPCQGTIGRWSRRRSAMPLMELTYKCYDAFFYKNWIHSDLLDRLTWSNIIPVIITHSHCPYGTKNGIIFIID